WRKDEVPPEAGPFRPLAMRIRNSQGQIAESVRSVEPLTVELEYQLDSPINGLRIGIYLMNTHGEVIFTSFDTDDPIRYEQYSVRQAGHYISRCIIPGDLLNEGRYMLGMNASVYRLKRYFQDEHAMSFNVDATGAPGKQWLENRQGFLRPRLNWEILIQ
ncbi:MAG: Wzt carbohydrate-binding domain-containing protein, partial [Anaerolineales bacterium]